MKLDVNKKEPKPVCLSSALPHDKASSLQQQLVNGWMDRFRTAGPDPTEHAVGCVGFPKEIWKATARTLDKAMVKRLVAVLQCLFVVC